MTRPAECTSGENFATIIAQFVCYVLQDQLSKLLSTLSQTCIKRGGGVRNLSEHTQWGQIEVALYAQPFKNQIHHPV